MSSEQYSLAMAASFSKGRLMIPQPAGLVEQVAAALDLHGTVRQLEGHGLELGNGLAELLAFAGVFQGCIIGPLGAPQPHGGDGETAAVQGLEHLVKAVSLPAQDILSRHAHVVEVELGRVGGTPHHLLFHGHGLEPGCRVSTIKQVYSGFPLGRVPVTA
jgi:hypothetical protein